MHSSTKVSVIMLAYNNGQYVEMAIKGVMRQLVSYQIQLVIAEDCSTDNTMAVCLLYKDKYPDQITLLKREVNLGCQRNFIDAHSHCVGEYIAICDGDDYWIDRHKLQRMTDFMDTHPDFSICFHRVINYYEENGTKSLSNGGQREITDITDLARSNYITNSSSLCRRSYYTTFPEWLSQVVSCDYAMHMLNAQHGKIYYFKKPMGVYRKSTAGIWSVVSQKDKQLRMAFYVRDFLLNYFLEKGNGVVYQNLLWAQTNIAISLIREYQKTNDTASEKEIEDYILNKHPTWNRTNIEQMLSVPSKKWCSQWGFKQLKRCRALLSLFIPLPRV